MKLLYTLIIVTLCTFSSAIGQEKRLPAFNFIDMQGKNVSNETIQSTSGFFMYFDPLCDVCGIEMKIIKSHLKYFQDKPIILVSPGRREDIEKFVKEYHLQKNSNITVIHDSKDDFYKSFQTNGYPSIFVFNNNNEITSKFYGEVPFEDLKNAFENPSQGINTLSSNQLENSDYVNTKKLHTNPLIGF